MGYTPSGSNLTPGTAGHIGGGKANQTVINTMYDLNPFGFERAVKKRHGRLPFFRRLLRLKGAAKPSSTPYVGHYETDWHYDLLEISARTVGATPGATATIQVATTNQVSVGATVSGTARTTIPFRKNDVIYFLNGRQARIENVDYTTSPVTLTIKPLRSDVTLDAATLTVGHRVPVLTNMWGEGTGINTGRLPRLFKYQNDFQIIKEGNGITGTELTNQPFPQFKQFEDGSIWAWIADDTLMRFERSVSYALLTGQQTSGFTELNPNLGHDVAVTGTEGLLTFADSYGTQNPYTAGTYSLAEFGDVASALEDEQINTRTLICLDGFNMFKLTQDTLLDTLNSDLSVAVTSGWAMSSGIAADDYQPFTNNSWDWYANFKSISFYGYTFHFCLMPEFNDKNGLGAPGLNFKSTRIIMPDSQMKDAKTGVTTASIGYNYKALDGYSREAAYGYSAGIGVGGTSPTFSICSNVNDLAQAAFVAEVAGHFACPNSIIVQKPT